MDKILVNVNYNHYTNLTRNRVTVSVTSVTFSKKGFSKGKNAEIIKLYSSFCGNKRLTAIKHYVLQP